MPNDVIAQLPRYAMPNITSSMPYYVNSEQEFVFRAFNTGNYDLLRHLPQDLKSAQVGQYTTVGYMARKRWQVTTS